MGINGTSDLRIMRAAPLSFSVITPSLTQAAFIEQTRRSVAGQNYPHYEYIVIHGGVANGIFDVLKKYPHLNWNSEKDGGQPDW